MSIPPQRVTTSLEFEGHRIVAYRGVVRGITVRSRNVFATFGASIQTLFGGKISLYTELCERAREEAFDLMRQHAAALGANAIVSMRYDANEVAPGVTEVLAYGTAVVIEARGGDAEAQAHLRIRLRPDDGSASWSCGSGRAAFASRPSTSGSRSSARASTTSGRGRRAVSTGRRWRSATSRSHGTRAAAQLAGCGAGAPRTVTVLCSCVDESQCHRGILKAVLAGPGS